jgi:serine/threonine protein kinase
VYRDLKPENVLIDPSKRCVSLIDCGCLTPASGEGFFVACSLAYLAPEQAMPVYCNDVEMHLAALSIKQDSYLVGRLGMDVMLPLRRQLDWAYCNQQDEDSIVAYLQAVEAADWKQELGMLRAAGLAATADLQAALLAANPEQRPTAAQALQHPCLAEAVAGMEAVVASSTPALLACTQSVLQLLSGHSPELQPMPCLEQQKMASPAEAANMSSSHSSSSAACGLSVEAV